MDKGIYEFIWHRDGAWLKEKLTYMRSEDTCGFVVLDNWGKQYGCAVFDSFLNSSANLTLVIESPACIKLGLLECAADWLFNTAEKSFCYAMIAQNNVPSLRITERVGFKHIYTIPKGFNDQTDMLVYELKKADLNLKSRKLRGADYGA